MIVIDSVEISGNILFTIVSGNTNASAYRWYLNDSLVSNESYYVLLSPTNGDYVYVQIDYNASETSWYDGDFYGGTFNGNFLGGRFHYGILNGEYYTKK